MRPHHGRPTDSDLVKPVLDSDGIHPNVLGYAAIGRSVFELPQVDAEDALGALRTAVRVVDSMPRIEPAR